MGFFKNLIGGTIGSGAGVAAVHNAHLAEFCIKRLTKEEKRRIAQTAIDMGVQASGFRITEENFIQTFNRSEKVSQLNVIALALCELGYNPLPADPWMTIKNPFMIRPDEKDIDVNSYYLKNKHNFETNITIENIDINLWLKG